MAPWRINPEEFCVRCHTEPAPLGSALCLACDAELANPHTPRPAQGIPINRRKEARPPKRIGYLAEGK